MATKRISDLDPVSRAKVAVRANKGATGYDTSLGASVASNVRRRSQTMAAEAAQKDEYNLAPTRTRNKTTMAESAATKDALNLGKPLYKK